MPPWLAFAQADSQISVSTLGRTVTLDPNLSLGVLFAQGPAGGQGAGGGGFSVMLPFMAMIGVLFYLMVLRPENKRRSEHDQMRKDLKKNDRVLTIGGIYGTVVHATQGSDDVTIRVDESTNTRLRITRNAVQTVLTNKEGNEND